MKKFLFIVASLSLILTSCETRNPNQTKVRDKNASEQADNETDRNITQRIRQHLLEDDRLSPNAKNIRIMTVNGVVTLRGTVNNEKERHDVLEKVQSVSGVRSIDNQIEVARSGNGAPAPSETNGKMNRPAEQSRY